jgi:hypothetical protein
LGISGFYIKGLLEELGFDASKIKANDTPEDYHNALPKRKQEWWYCCPCW